MCMAFAHLFWPSFVLVNDCVLLRKQYEPQNFEKWWHELDGNRTKVEAMINHVHLYDLFSPESEVEAEQDVLLVELGEILVRCWSAALAQAFPGRRFDVQLHNSGQDYGPTIVFKTMR